MSLEHVACDICGSEASDLVAKVPDRSSEDGAIYDVVRCAMCGLVFTNPRPHVDRLHEHYGSGYFPFEKLTGVSARIDRLRSTRAERSLRTLAGRPGRVLEVGCGVGRFLETLRDAGWTTHGIEPSERAVETATARGLDVQTGTLETVRPDGIFDVVVMRHALEHVPSPSATAEAVRTLLAPGGHLVVTVPNYDSIERKVLGAYWGDYDVPRHLYHFEPRTLTRLLRDRGFGSVRFKFSIVPNAWVWAAHHKLADRGSTLAKRITPNSAAASAVFLPLSLLTAAFRRSSRVEVVAEKA